MGYSDYQSDSERMYELFASDYPGLTDRNSAWQDITSSLNKVQPDSRTLFYFPTSLRGDAPRLIDRTLAKRKSLAVISADEDERGYAPISYYVELLTKAAGSLVYLLAPSRVRATMHNARASLLGESVVALIVAF